MKTNSERRAAAWKILREGGWVTKFVMIWILLLLIGMLVQGCLLQARLALGYWTQPFEIFFTCILNGIVAFACNALFLMAAKGEGKAGLSPAFGGFKYPLGVAWLHFRYSVQVMLWSLLFIVPGIIAIYRYSQCWNLKVEHPDWSAGRCLAESGRIMKGHKRERFAFDCSYWRPITLVLVLLLVATAVGILPMPPLLGVALVGTLSLVAAWASLILAVYMSIGQALFYLEVTTNPPLE